MLLYKLRKDLTFSHIRDFMSAKWESSKSRRTHKVKVVFNDARERHFKKENNFSPAASECVDMLPLLRYFLELSRPHRPVWKPFIDSFVALCDAVEVTWRCKHGEQLADDMDRAWATHAAMYDVAYGSAGRAAYSPKYHFTRHLARQVRLDGFAMDTFACERHHRMVLDAAQDCATTPVFERTVLTISLIRHESCIAALRRDGLVQPQAWHDMGVGWSVAPKAIWLGNAIAAGDMVRIGPDLVCVGGIAHMENTTYIIGRATLPLEEVTTASTRWQFIDWALYQLQGRVRHARYWAHECADRVLVIEG
jgi:hypothetical protein